MCQYGLRVGGRLREWHVSLIQEADCCCTMVETEVAKAEAKMEIENAALRKEIEIWQIKYQAMKKNYRT
jgi:hypothetical protein